MQIAGPHPDLQVEQKISPERHQRRLHTQTANRGSFPSFVYFYFPNFNLLTKHYNDGQMASKIEAFVLVWCLTDSRA